MERNRVRTEEIEVYHGKMTAMAARMSGLGVKSLGRACVPMPKLTIVIIPNSRPSLTTLSATY